jgi:imidazolonepropionase-like amidohydrolase
LEYTTTDKLIIIANVVKKLVENSFRTGPGPDTCRAALYLEKGVLRAIREVAPETVFEKPEGWKLKKLPPEWILTPAFLDCHVHVALDGINGFNNFTGPPSASTIRKRLRQAVKAGIFALRDGGDFYNTGILAARLKKEPSGNIFYPEIIPTGQAIFRKGYYGSKLGVGIMDTGGIDSLLQQLADNGAKQVKLILSGLVSLKTPWKVGPLQFSFPELKTIVQKSREFGLPVMVHVNGAKNVHLAIKAGVHTVEHGYYVKRETLQLMADNNVAWVPTVAPLAAMLEGQNNHAEIGTAQKNVIRQAVEHQLMMIKAAQELGVTLGLGTDTGAPGVGWGNGFQQEFKHYLKAGLSPQTVLQIATINNAHLLGLSHKMGKIERGKKPCWICLHKDILQGKLERSKITEIVRF